MAKVKNVYFTDDDLDLFNYSNSLPNFSKWVKQRLLMEKDNGNIEALINKLIDAKLGNNTTKTINNDDFNQFI